MDAFSLLRYWRSNNAGGSGGGSNDSTNNASTIVTAVSTQTSDTEEEEEDDENDHGPFFDLEFSLPNEDKNGENENGAVFEESDGSESGNEVENGVVSVCSPPPCDELFFKGGVVVDKTMSSCDDELKGKECQSQTRVSLMKSATKLRVMMLKFNNNNNNNNNSKKSNLKNEEEEKKVGTIGEPIVSLFKRHNSKLQKKRQNDGDSVTNEDKKFSKEAMQRYLRKVKPLYVRVSKLKFSGQLKQTLVPSSSPEAEKQSPATNESNLEASEVPLMSSNGKGGLKQGNLPAGLRVVCKHLGKTRSAVVAAAPISSKRRDDSLLQQQDGIQSAILHCKRSFKASRGSDSDCSSNISSESVAASGKSSSSEAAETVEIGKVGNDGEKAGN